MVGWWWDVVRSANRSRETSSIPPARLSASVLPNFVFSAMAPTTSKKRKIEDGMRGKVARAPKRSRKQQHYDSDSSGDDAAEDLEDTNGEAQTVDGGVELTGANRTTLDQSSASESESNNSASSVTDASSESESSQPRSSKKRKRNDPDAFATSMSKILGSKLSTSKRADPVLARSKTALAASQELSNSRLEAKAKRKLREEKKAELDKGRVRDVLGLDSAAASAEGGVADGKTVGEIAELEKRLRKTAQRGVVKLFNAVRAAQVKAEEAAREARKQGVVGVGRREQKATEMSKQGFLELIGGTSAKTKMIEEA